MAIGDTLLFNATPFFLGSKLIRLGDTGYWRAGLTGVAFSTLDAAFSYPRFGETNLPEVTAGGHYPAGGLVLTTAAQDLTAVESQGVMQLALDTSAHPEGRLVMSATTGNPTFARTMIIYDSLAFANEAVMAIDITEDGSTLVNLQSRELSLYIGSTSTTGVFFSLSVV